MLQYEISTVQTTTRSGLGRRPDAARRSNRASGFDGDATVNRLWRRSPRPVRHRRAGGALLRRFYWGPGADEPVMQDEGGALNCTGTHYLSQDELGSIVATADCYGNQTAVNTYDEYGIPGSGNWGRFQYTGQAWIPDLGMSYYKARLYSPTLGRFLQTDPIGYGDGPNWYAYVHNNPVNGTDPAGTDGDDIGAEPEVSANAVDAELSGLTVTSVCGGGCLSGQAASDFVNAQGAPGFGIGGVGVTVSELVVTAKPKTPDNTVSELVVTAKANHAQEEVEPFPRLTVPEEWEGPPQLPRIPFPMDPNKPPGPGWIWRGSGPPGTRGNWINPKTGERLNPDLDHPP